MPKRRVEPMEMRDDLVLRLVFANETGRPIDLEAEPRTIRVEIGDEKYGVLEFRGGSVAREIEITIQPDLIHVEELGPGGADEIETFVVDPATLRKP